MKCKLCGTELITEGCGKGFGLCADCFENADCCGLEKL